MDLSSIEQLLKQPLFALTREEKQERFLKAIRDVTVHHYKSNTQYRKLLEKRKVVPETIDAIEDIPFLPASIFKGNLLLSIPQKQLFREIKSSATTSGIPSKVGLDRMTSQRQVKCFNRIVIDRIGNVRRPFIILDTPETIQRTQSVSARSSTIKSLLFSAKNVSTYINEKSGKLIVDIDRLISRLARSEKEKDEAIIFGFTYILYRNVIKEIVKKGISYNLDKSSIIHIGGWKKLESEKVSPEKLISDCNKVLGVKKQNIIDFYGFTEQSGMIYPTCENNVRHVPLFGDVVVRDPVNLEPVEDGKTGLLQFLAPIQTSYPGHSVLTEDVGYIVDSDNCSCGRMGKTFKVVGRSKNAEIRGCGDIMAENFA